MAITLGEISVVVPTFDEEKAIDILIRVPTCA